MPAFGMAGNIVSILARSCERAQPMVEVALTATAGFQSSPAHVSGRNFMGRDKLYPAELFQSSPAHVSGRNCANPAEAADQYGFNPRPLM